MNWSASGRIDQIHKSLQVAESGVDLIRLTCRCPIQIQPDQKCYYIAITAVPIVMLVSPFPLTPKVTVTLLYHSQPTSIRMDYN